MVPSVQSAWETIIHKNCTEAKRAAVRVYDKTTSTQLVKCKLPCDSDDIRKIQKNAVEESMAVFQAETVGISAINSVKYLEKLMVRRKYRSCSKVFHKMKREHASYSFDRPLILYIYFPCISSTFKAQLKQLALRNAP